MDDPSIDRMNSMKQASGFVPRLYILPAAQRWLWPELSAVPGCRILKMAILKSWRMI